LEPHGFEPLAEPRVAAEAVPLRSDGQVDEGRIAEGNRLVQTVERLVESARGAE
jgi:hypothetical protein